MSTPPPLIRKSASALAAREREQAERAEHHRLASRHRGRALYGEDEAFDLHADGSDHKCEARLIAKARALHTKGKHIIPIIDDAHLIPTEALRKLRLLLDRLGRLERDFSYFQP